MDQGEFMTKEVFYDKLAINIEKIRIERGLSQSEMAQGLDLSLSAYKRLINRESSHFDLYTALKMYELTHALPNTYVPVDYEDRFLKIISKLEQLTEQQLIYVNAVVEVETQFKIENPDTVDDYMTVFVPTGDFEDGMIFDSANVEKINISKYKNIFGHKAFYGIKVTSNHLHPTYNLGDVLLISKEPIRDGDVGIFLNKDNARLYIRKFKQTNPCQLIPVNDYGMPIEVDSYDLDDMGKWVKFGKVLTKIR